MKTKSSTLSIRIDESMKKRLQRKNLNLAEFIRERLIEYLDAKVCPVCGHDVKKSI